MSILIVIIISTFLMSMIAWIGLALFFVKEDILRRILEPLIAFAAGSLLGGAFLHLIIESIDKFDNKILFAVYILAGILVFFFLEQFLHWHHCHKLPEQHYSPVSYMILIADGLHNFIGGLAIGGSFLVSINVGIVTWVSAAAHEIPQEFGDFGILLHGGWHKTRALIVNYLSALTVVVGGVVAYFMSRQFNVDFLLPFAAGNFIYIAASDLIPEVVHSHEKDGECGASEEYSAAVLKQKIIHSLAFTSGIGFILVIKLLVE